MDMARNIIIPQVARLSRLIGLSADLGRSQLIDWPVHAQADLIFDRLAKLPLGKNASRQMREPPASNSPPAVRTSDI